RRAGARRRAAGSGAVAPAAARSGCRRAHGAHRESRARTDRGTEGSMTQPSAQPRRVAQPTDRSAQPLAPDPTVGPATPRGHRNADGPFPFPPRGRWSGKKKLPANSERRQPWVDVEAVDPSRIEPRFVRSPVSLAEFVQHVREAIGVDDVGVISIDHPAIAHELDEIRYVYPHCRSLVVMVGEQNQASMQSRYLPTANHELYQCEERLFAWGHAVMRYLRTLGAAGLTTTIGWPQEVSQRWADKLWPLSHKLVAQAAGLGVI